MKPRANRTDCILWVKESMDAIAGVERMLRCINSSSTGMKFEGEPSYGEVTLKVRMGATIHETKAKVVRVEDNAFAVQYINPPKEFTKIIDDLAS